MEGIIIKKGYIYAIIAPILFGSAGLFIKLGYGTGLDSISILTVQYILAVILMFIVILIRNKKELKISKNKLFNLAILGIVGNTFMSIFYYKAFEYLPVSLVTILLYTYPIMVFIYSCVFKKEKISSKKILAVVLAFIGCMCTLDFFHGKIQYSMIGIIFGILCAVFYAFMNIYTESKLEDIPPLIINAYSTLFALITILIYNPPVFLFKTNFSFESLFYIFILAVVCEVIPLTLLYSAIRYIGSLKVSVLGNLEIPSAVLLSFIFLKESISPIQILGMVLVIFAAILIKK
ncbi:DMT family transporter [Haloimpatiens sp. FM7330]|uniref:DMT family transporter n=1 Tax=Haloimpatiens sp. FM7330 TaxID=3298610 RepID=UPI00363C57B7